MATAAAGPVSRDADEPARARIAVALSDHCEWRDNTRVFSPEDTRRPT
jgi:hypothetical protein